ncbi:MAG: sensor histidine kinase [Deltaproteobacteria bacterium]|nr:MAG: sensor histidine kinase [Deltaproteobacteria bacterium]
MRFSVSTRIFLGFAVVIIAFGSTCAYALYKMSGLRRSVTVVWKEVIPVSNQMKALSRQLKSAEELFDFKRPSDGTWLQQVLPSLEPFTGPQGLEIAAQRLETLAQAEGTLADEDRAELGLIAGRMKAFIEGRELLDMLTGEGGDTLLIEGDYGPLSNRELYDRLVRRTLKKASLGELKKASEETAMFVRVLRRINRELGDTARALAGPIRAIDQRAEADERTTSLAVIIIASVALVLSLLMLWMSQLTLRPIRDLREGARRIAAGDYHDRVKVTTSDEIGQLAAEFNTMAESLMKRDAELERQREELMRADRLAVIGKLAAQITHEVRNPLSSIGLNAELLEEELEDLEDAGDARASLGAIIREVQRLKSITEEYLHFARLPRPELASVDVGALLSQFLTFLQHEVKEAGVSLTSRGVVASLEGGPPPVKADADQLRQAILNIARNAIEALRTVEEPRELEVSLEPRAGGGVRIRIADNGPGIDDALRERIFEPFVTGKSHGTGLGLALTREIVVEHGGTIDAVSPLEGGRGTAFVIELTLDGPTAG